MKTYTITYLNGQDEEIQAAGIEMDYDTRTFTARDEDSDIILVAPITTIRSVRRHPA
jgi:hypothetical protein